MPEVCSCSAAAYAVALTFALLPGLVMDASELPRLRPPST